MASNYASYTSGTLTGGLTYYFQNVTNVVSTTSTTWADSGLAITPPLAGTYLIIARTSIFAEGGGATIGQTRLAIQSGATTTEIAGTLGQTRNTVVMVLGLIGGNNIDSSASLCVGVASVNGNQTIKMQYNLGSSGSTITLNNRTMVLVKVA